MQPGQGKGFAPGETTRTRCQSKCKESVEGAGLMPGAPAAHRRSQLRVFSGSSFVAPSAVVEGALIAEDQKRPRRSPKVTSREKLEEQPVDDRVIESRDRCILLFCRQG